MLATNAHCTFSSCYCGKTSASSLSKFDSLPNSFSVISVRQADPAIETMAIYTLNNKSKFQLTVTIGVFLIAFVMSVIEKLTGGPIPKYADNEIRTAI